MNSCGQIVLLCAVALCLVQVAVGRTEYDGRFLVENVRHDLTRKCFSTLRDFQRDVENARYKVTKEVLKAKRKNGNVADCVDTASLTADGALDAADEDVSACTDDLKNALDMNLKENATVREVFIFRNMFKDQLNDCKKEGKATLKQAMNEFSLATKLCLK